MSMLIILTGFLIFLGFPLELFDVAIEDVPLGHLTFHHVS
jgi:hypothetical protein